MPKSETQKWEHFERLVAAIHKAADDGADVRWNEKIGKRQFDVTIRFKKGMHDYLTVVECKNYKKPVPAEKVDAFVTKARDAGAHNAIMASPSGFQNGAQEVADKHNITLLNVEDTDQTDIAIFGAKFGEPQETLHIKAVKLVFENGEKAPIPERADMFSYYAHSGFLQKDGQRSSLHDNIYQYDFRFEECELDQYKTHIIKVLEGVEFVSPDQEISSGPLREIYVEAGKIVARTYTGPYQFEPYLLTPHIQVQNIKTGDKNIFSQLDLALGVNTKFKKGKFYESPQLAANYYCEAVNDDLTELILVESFQHGKLCQARIKLKTTYQNRYVEVKDKNTVKRLERRLEQFRSKSKKSA